MPKTNEEIEGMDLPYEERIAPLTLAMHMPILFIGWLIYLYFFIKIVRFNDALMFIILLLIIFFIVVFATSLFWIMYNIHIYHKKGPRTHVRPFIEKYQEDWHHREIIANWKILKKAQKIQIDINKSSKKYYKSN